MRQLQAIVIRVRRDFAVRLGLASLNLWRTQNKPRGMRIIARPYFIGTTDQTSPPPLLTRHR